MKILFRSLFFVILFTSVRIASAQLSPAPDARLNYTQIMFDHDRVQGADTYLIEVADSSDPYFLHPVAHHVDSFTAAMLSGFEFGRECSWRYEGLRSGQPLGWHGPYHFGIDKNVFVNNKYKRIRVLENDSNLNAGGLITMDMARVIVDRRGDFVWFLPEDTEALATPVPTLDDFRITPYGTVTLISSGHAEERDLGGHLLWSAPPHAVRGNAANGQKLYRYHHCFERLASGHYMALDRDTILVPSPSSGAGGHLDTARVAIEDEIIKEFDHSGRIVWSWSSEKYFSAAEVNKMVQSQPDSGLLDPTPGGHLNAFWVDEKKGFIYAGFRNVSRVIKIEKATGRVVCEWGDGMQYHGQPNGDGFFAKQHDATLLRDGSLIVFSNGDREPPAGRSIPLFSSIVDFSQPGPAGNSKVLWQFDTHIDGVDYQSLRGGNVQEMKNGNLLICMGAVDRVLEVTRDKKIVWSAVIEKQTRRDPSFRPLPLNRAHYTSSLYPCYFTAQTVGDTILSGAGLIPIRISNIGSEPDAYDIEVTSQRGFYKRHLSTGILSTSGSAYIDIAPQVAPRSSDRIEITVRSGTNPALSRTIHVSYKKVMWSKMVGF